MAGFEFSMGAAIDGAALAPRPAFDPVSASFEQLVGTAEQHGANRGLPRVIALYRNWIAAQSGGSKYLYAAWFNLGVELSCQGDRDGAILAYRTALAIRPDFSLAAINLGLALERGGDAEAALASWSGALQSDDSRTSLINHQARLLESTARLEAAEQRLRTSLLTTPMQPDVIQHWIHIRQKLCAWPILTHAVPGLDDAALRTYCGPLAALALFDSVAQQTDTAAGWIARKTHAVPQRLSPQAGYAHDKIRVGYLSSDFCRHAMSFLIAELFERHDRSQFEITGYCATAEDHSPIRRRVLAAFDHVRPIRDVTDEAAARQIRADEIDILIDLNGLTQGSRIQVLRWRPAPVQATYLGFVGPVPLPELDYLFCDDGVIPPAIASSYRPQPLAIAANYQANDSKREIGAPITRHAAGLPPEGFVFCCFSNHYKITQAMFACWMEILRHTAGAYLWLIADNAWSCANLRRAAARAGIDPGRLIFAGRASPADYMARLAVADLFLDTYPYNAGTIASDAIRMGLPLLTRQGETFASRMASRLLAAMGATGGIATDDAAYVAAAITLARDTQAYAAYKAHFTEATWAATIGDIGTLTRQLEATLQRIVCRPSATQTVKTLVLHQK
jgi:predicted O-linked N-acetylglucosamine transferase (SPINDLY family)